MSADQAYIQSVSYTQGQFAKLDGDQAEMKAQLAAALAELKALRDRARTQDQSAKSVLTKFAAGDGAAGVDALMQQADAKAQASAADYKSAGALAYAVDTGRAIKAYEAALKFAPEDNDILLNLAQLYYSRLSDFDVATSYAQKLVALGARKQDASIEADGYFVLGLVARARRDIAAADKADLHALALYEKLGDKSGQATTLNNLGYSASLRNDMAAATAYQERSLKLNIELGDTEGQEHNYANLGYMALLRGDLANAELYKRRGLELALEGGAKENIAGSYTDLGDVLRRRGQMTEACMDFRKSKALYAEIGAEKSTAARDVAGYIAQYCPS
jgi:tetratricopeptide (TPR) repeat protein